MCSEGHSSPHHLPRTLLVLQERDPAVKAASSSEHRSAEQEPGSVQPSNAVEGYIPRHPKVSSDGAKKVCFAPSAKQPASPPQPHPADPALPGSSLDAFLRGRHKSAPEAFDIIPIPANPADPQSPSIEDLLDQAQALRPQQPSTSPVQPHSFPPKEVPPQDASQAPDVGQIEPESTPSLASKGHRKQLIKPALRQAAPHRSQMRQADQSDSEDGSLEGSEMDDRWDDYGVVDDAHLKGHARLAGPSLHPREVDASAADLDPFTQQGNVEAGARLVPTLPHHLQQPGRRPDSQQGPVIERHDAEAGAMPGTAMTNYLQPARGLPDEVTSYTMACSLEHLTPISAPQAHAILWLTSRGPTLSAAASSVLCGYLSCGHYNDTMCIRPRSNTPPSGSSKALGLQPTLPVALSGQLRIVVPETTPCSRHIIAKPGFFMNGV